jgi:hypothetical protein
MHRALDPATANGPVPRSPVPPYPPFDTTTVSVPLATMQFLIAVLEAARLTGIDHAIVLLNSIENVRARDLLIHVRDIDVLAAKLRVLAEHAEFTATRRDDHDDDTDLPF